jgi:acyl carrier protein
MRNRPEIAAAVYRVLVTRWPGRFVRDQLADDVSLGSDGLGLDSIEIVEVLLACDQDAAAGTVRVEELLENGPITVGRLIDHLVRL